MTSLLRLLCLPYLFAGLPMLTNANAATAADLTPAQKLIATPRVLITAHRGNSSVAPENTLPAFQSALDVQADLVELDYCTSSPNSTFQ